MVLPFLIGSSHILFQNKNLLEALVSGLLELIDDKTYLILGIDFCHLGLRYGDPLPADEALLKEALNLDNTLLQLTFEGKSDLLETLIRKYEHMKICGASSLYLLSLLVQKGSFKGRGEIYYQEALPFGEASFVSVASAGFIF